jgi:hypothetical protein
MNLIERNFESKQPDVEQLIASSKSSDYYSTPMNSSAI